MTTNSEQADGRSGLWLYNPWLDLILGCGAWTVPLLLLTYYTSSHELAWGVAFYALALVFNYPHYMATLYRAYHTREDFRKYRVFTGQQRNQFAYASLLKAKELLASSAPSQVWDLVQQQLVDMEHTLGGEAATVRSHAQQVRSQALALTV